jgi:hypothetical protein
MIICLDEACHAYQRAGRMKTQHDLFEAITYGAVQRVRPKLRTDCMITFVLVPALGAHGGGAEAIQRIAHTDDGRRDHLDADGTAGLPGDFLSVAQAAGDKGSGR